MRSSWPVGFWRSSLILRTPVRKLFNYSVSGNLFSYSPALLARECGMRLVKWVSYWVLHTAIMDVYKGGLYTYTCTIAKPAQSSPRQEHHEHQVKRRSNSDSGDGTKKSYQKGVWGKNGGCIIITSPKTRGTISILFRRLCWEDRLDVIVEWRPS